MRLYKLDSSPKAITGGHIYNKQLLSTMSEAMECDVVEFESVWNKYEKWGWKKIFAPFKEIAVAKNFKKGDIVFFSDTSLRFHMLLMLYTSLIKRINATVIIHHFSYLGESGFKRRCSYWAQRIYYGMAKNIIVPSPYTKALAEKMFKSKVSYIPLAFSNEYRPSTNYTSGNLLYVGTIEHRKGIMYLLEAARILRDQKQTFHIDFVGKVVDEQYYMKLQSYIAANSLEQYVKFRGRVETADLDRYYNQAELFVFPSLLEGYGIVLVEAMQRGLPIIAFNNSAIPYTVVDGQTGYLAKNMDSTDLAEKIKLMLNDKSLRETMQPQIKTAVEAIKTEKDFNKAVADFILKVRR